MRADAQRNYERLLQEASQAFTVHGTDVALEDIARHAGVGIGTLYRHFPDRSALVNAVFTRDLDALTDRAHDLLDAADPAQALLDWLRTFAAQSAAYRGLAASLLAQQDQRIFTCKGRLLDASTALLERAQEAGTVRRGVEMADLLRLTSAIQLCAEKNPEDPRIFHRLMELAAHGVVTPRPDPAG
jgi:AcrR family transcriptional regulator